MFHQVFFPPQINSHNAVTLHRLGTNTLWLSQPLMPHFHKQSRLPLPVHRIYTDMVEEFCVNLNLIKTVKRNEKIASN